jgi:hypothetical protein
VPAVIKARRARQRIRDAFFMDRGWVRVGVRMGCGRMGSRRGIGAAKEGGRKIKIRGEAIKAFVG